MSTRSRLSLVAPPSLCLLLVVACHNPPSRSADAEKTGNGKLPASLSRLRAMKELRFAFETSDEVCELEFVSGAQAINTAPKSRWVPFHSTEHLREKYQVHGLDEMSAGTSSTVVAVHVRDEKGNNLWLRNAPSTGKTASGAARAWRCAVDQEWIAKQKPALEAKYVQLDLTNPTCDAITPILGGRADVTLSPYLVVDVGLYAGAPPDDEAALKGGVGALAVGMRLAAEGGDKQLTVPMPVFNRCFVAAHRSPPLPAESEALQRWLESSNPDASPPPSLPLETLEAAAGIDRSRCLREQLPAGEHLECRLPVLRITPADDAGPFGPSKLLLARDRVVDAFHFVNGRLVAPTETVRVEASARLPGLRADSTFAVTFRRALDASMQDGERTLQRAVRGFRLRGEEASATSVTHHVNLQLDFQVPELETTSERRLHRYIAGKKKVHNDAFDRARQDLQQAKNDLESAEKQLERDRQSAKEATALTENACKGGGSKVASMIPIPGSSLFGSALAGAGCAGVIDAVATGRSEERVKTARERLKKAQITLDDTPEELSVDDQRTFEYEARTYRRRGSATAKVTIAPVKAGGPEPFAASFQVPFDASDLEIPDDPEHKLTGKKASPPSADAAERALAEALVPLVDAAIIRWGAQRQVGGDIGDLRPGSRSWVVAVARRAAADRNLKLLSDLLENRSEELDHGKLRYPVHIPEGSEKRCFTFTGVPLDASADVNLALGREREQGGVTILARDARRDPDAALEVCNLTPGDYIVGVAFGEGKVSRDGVLVSMFDSTPGGPSAQDTQQASQGLPTRPRKGEAMALQGSGLVTFQGAGGKEIQGRTGDRDGDGVLDDQDRCPYDPEIKNGYLDEDGCPDEVPKGWTPPVAASGRPPTGPTPTVVASTASAETLEKQSDFDFAGGNFERASERLEQASLACAASKCTDATLARLLLKQGVVLGHSGKKAEAQRKFAAALKIDPKAVPEPGLLTPELKKIWEQARLLKGKR